MTPLDYIHLQDTTDADRYGAILQQCFNITTWEEEPFYARLGMENYRIIRQGNNILGGVALIPMGQWFGGRRVAMAGIAGVAISAEHRGQKVAQFMMEQVLQELYATGIALSTLYPAIHRLYRKLGYGQGGVYYSWNLSTADIDLRERCLPIHPVPPMGNQFPVDSFHTLYQQQAQIHNGHLDRHPRIWHDRLHISKQSLVYAYLLGHLDYPEGYLVINQHRNGSDSIIQVRDWALLTPAAINTFWTFLADQRSQLDVVRWQSAAIDPLSLVLPEPSAHVDYASCWLLRLINLPLALEQRGYPAHIEAELHLSVFDDLLSPNNGNFLLTVTGGRGTVCPGGKGDLRVHIRGLASLYSSLLTPHQLRALGLLEGTDADLAMTAAVFGGTSPWLPDFF